MDKTENLCSSSAENQSKLNENEDLNKQTNKIFRTELFLNLTSNIVSKQTFKSSEKKYIILVNK